jgi:hypothetical protein
MRQLVSEGQEIVARREGWSSASPDRRAERSMKRIKGRTRKGKITEQMVMGNSTCVKMKDGCRMT